MFMGEFHRGRRLRRTPALREMVRETELRPDDLIQGYFVVDTPDADFERPIPSMPGQSQFSVDKLVDRVGWAMNRGLRAALLFGLPEKKDPVGSGAYAEDGIVQRAVTRLKEAYPEMVVVTDVCLCEYTSHGHCGLLDDHGEVRNDPTLELLAKTAVSHARAGADIIAPSDMMDGRVAAIRSALDEAGFAHLPVMSYAVKYASAFYGPFREAADSAPAFGDRRGYQMDPANWREALREASADLAEGADILMVKPAMPYLDVVRQLRDAFDTPIAAYQVSGEYAMLRAAIVNGWLDPRRAVLESLLGIKRAGADMIITYFAEEVLEWL
jgi:porphobilinogen synthase